MWQFREMSRAEMNLDPVHNEFFGPEEGYTAALVRETIQNSLDAKAGADPVSVRFAFGEVPISRGTFAQTHFFDALPRHLIAQELYVPEGHEIIPFLSIEDFGTRGFRGDPFQDADEAQDAGTKNDFFYFWRNVGRSQKGGNERGRWGLGKTVFPASSKIHSFFGLSKRNSEPQEVLMGQCVGRMHKIGDAKYPFYGYFAEHQEDGFPLPITANSTIEDFRSLFALRRTTETGLSLVIPFPQSDLEASDIVREVILSYYVPIIRNELTVAVADDRGEVHITEQTIDELAREAEWERESTSAAYVMRLIQFARATLQAENAYELSLYGGTSQPVWSESDLRNCDWWAHAQDRYDNDDLVMFNVPIAITLNETQMQSQDMFKVFLQRDPELSGGRGDFVRQGLTISQIGKPPKTGVRGLVLVSDGYLSMLLGDSENPAHTKWQERARGLKDKYKYGASTVRFVSSTLAKLSQYLSTPAAGVDRTVMTDFFFVELPPTDDPTVTEGQQPERPDRVKPPIILPITKRKAHFRIDRIAGGFRVTGIDSERAPEPVLVKVAYSVRRGNPFARYSETDFKLSDAPIVVRVANAEVRPGVNTLEIVPSQAGFTVDVSGFDPNRDLEISARTRKSA